MLVSTACHTSIHLNWLGARDYTSKSQLTRFQCSTYSTLGSIWYIMDPSPSRPFSFHHGRHSDEYAINMRDRYSPRVGVIDAEITTVFNMRQAELTVPVLFRKPNQQMSKTFPYFISSLPPCPSALSQTQPP
jgi:hypothetical protein